MVLIGYLAIGALIYNRIMDLEFENALYFVIVSCTSVGFGDITPSNTAAKILTFFYTSTGIVFIAITIAQAREVLVESFAAAYKHRRAVLAGKVKERRARKREVHERKLRLQKEARARGETDFAVDSAGSLVGQDKASTFTNTRQGGQYPNEHWRQMPGTSWLRTLFIKLRLRESEQEASLSKRLDRFDSVSRRNMFTI